jgi:hypothetical protein
VVYELWRDDSLNLSAAFKTEREALAAVREEVARNGSAIVLRTILVRADSRGNRTEIAAGQQLVSRALGGDSPGNGRTRSARARVSA